MMDIMESAYNFSLKTCLGARPGSNVANLFDLCSSMNFKEHVELRWLIHQEKDYNLT